MKTDDPQSYSTAPRATYRLQLTAENGLDQAAAVADYLAALGISHLYTSPFFQAAPGSTHGYDGVDPEHISKELGGEEAFKRLTNALNRCGLGLVVDVVPNHLSIACRENWRWWDVLRLGPESPYAEWFDIDWQAPQTHPPRTILLPILGDQIGICLQNGDIRLLVADDAPAETNTPEDRLELAYYEQHFPVAPGSIPGLTAAMSDADLQAALDGTNHDHDALEAVVNAQHYRLACWKTGPDELNYRRFFAVNELVGVRVELPHVFQQMHRRVLELVRDGTISGLRIDHPDGLRDPAAYLQRLRSEAPQTWMVVEKIIQPGEQLPDDWPVQGTTGYDFLNQLGGLWIDPRGEAALSLLYARLTGSDQDYATVLRESKAHVGRVLFSTETTRLVHLLSQVCRNHASHRDYTQPQLRTALERMLVAFPVYRSYATPDEDDERAVAGIANESFDEKGRRAISAQDAGYICRSADEALRTGIGLKSTSLFRATIPPPDARLIEFIRDILLMRVSGPGAAEFIFRFQQLTGPLMAKGAEDTAFYRYNRLIALNEVGGNPAQMTLPLADFHRLMTESAERWPTTMRATSTHDTKRSEDVRTRIALLSEIPGQWAHAVGRWERLAAPMCPHERPDANDRYFIYQTLVGAWPITLSRLTGYMLKADREAKRHTSWKDPAPLYEQDLQLFLQRLLADEEFLADLQQFIAPLIGPARRVSLAQTLVKLTVPGVPDIYQGCELEDLSLVDPDNRRAVDFPRRRALLDELIRAERSNMVNVAAILSRSDEGLPKLFLTRRTLALRQALPQAFAAGAGYNAIWAAGPMADYLIAFGRTSAADSTTTAAAVIALAPRWPMRLSDTGWAHTAINLPRGPWRNVFTDAIVDGGEALDVGHLLNDFPVALLARADLLADSPLKEILARGFNRD